MTLGRGRNKFENLCPIPLKKDSIKYVQTIWLINSRVGRRVLMDFTRKNVRKNFSEKKQYRNPLSCYAYCNTAPCFSGLIRMTALLSSFLRQTGDTILIQTVFVWISAYVWSDGLTVRQLDSPTFLHKIEEKRRLMLFESLCSICISMFPLLSLKNEGNSRQIIYVAYKTVGLLSCRNLWKILKSNSIHCESDFYNNVFITNSLLWWKIYKAKSLQNKTWISNLSDRLKKKQYWKEIDRQWRITSDCICFSTEITYPNCKLTRLGMEYRGNISITTSGKTCQRWDSQSPHSHDYGNDLPLGASIHENYCRSPDSEDAITPWCYTTDANVRWEYCDIPICGK